MTDPPPFRNIVCGVDDRRQSQEAARQALALAAGGGTVHFVAIADAVPLVPTWTATLSATRADRALAEAEELAHGMDVSVTTARLEDPLPAERLLHEARPHDLLVVGARAASRAHGLVHGETAAAALHRAPLPVLVARRPDDGTRFPAHVLAATRARRHERPVVEVAARLARRWAVPLTLLHVTGVRTADVAEELALQAAAARDVAGAPTVLREDGRPVDRILELADSHAGTLVVMGSGERRGLDALGSVSERVGARAPASVLVMRGT